MVSIQKLNGNVERFKRETEQKKSELDQQLEKATRIQQRRDQLTSEIEVLTDELFYADTQFESFKARCLQLYGTMVEMWSGQTRGQLAERSVPDYAGIVVLEKAIADFPRVRSILEARVTEAEKRLHDFEQAS